MTFRHQLDHVEKARGYLAQNRSRRADTAPVANRSGYAQRLLHGNWLRAWLHRRRFEWLVGELKRRRLMPVRMVEVGCNDGMLVDFLDAGGVAISNYLGFDVAPDVLQAAQERYRARPEIVFRNATAAPVLGSDYNVAACMETFEHLRSEEVEGWLDTLSRSLKGCLFVTAPVERGPNFLVKHFAQWALRLPAPRKSVSDVVNLTLGRTHRVVRDHHKGFDDRVLVRQIARYFDVEQVRGLFCPRPLTLNFTIGIIARSRNSES
jgi:2-polyprenyl-3-methyl-5-hydroxy-6-metoxy-1,4-benzoquinol methylase